MAQRTCIGVPKHSRWIIQWGVMHTRWAAALAAESAFLGVGLGFAAAQRGAGIDAIRGKGAPEAAAAALTEAERLAGRGSWELIAVGRV